MSALQGIRVVELAHEFGAYAGKLLADMGAEVVLVEPPGGCAMRDWAPFLDDVPHRERSLHFWHYHTSKRGVTLDLGTEAGVAALRRLLGEADVLVECEAPGRLDALGLSKESIAALRPELVHASITPFGQDGGDAPATDLTLLAAGGPAWSCGYDDHSLPPVRGGGGQAGHIAGQFAVNAILTAILHRELESGRGQHIDVNMLAAANVTTEMASYHWHVSQEEVQRQTGRHAMAQPTLPSQIRCADGRHVTTGVPPRKPAEFASLAAWVRELGLADEIPEFVFLEMGAARESIDLSLIGQDDEVTAIFGAGRESLNLIASKVSAKEFFLGCQEAGLTAGVIYSPEEAYEDPHFVERGFPVEVEHPELGRTVRYPGAPYRLEGSPWRIARRAPLIGEHNEEVFEALGLSSDEIASLGVRR